MLILVAALLVLPARFAVAGPFETSDGLAVPVSIPATNVWLERGPVTGGSSFVPDGQGGDATPGFDLLDALNLPGEFGFIVQHSEAGAYYDGFAYRPMDGLQFEASWDYDDNRRSVEGFLDLRLKF